MPPEYYPERGIRPRDSPEDQRQDDNPVNIRTSQVGARIDNFQDEVTDLRKFLLFYSFLISSHGLEHTHNKLKQKVVIINHLLVDVKYIMLIQ